MFFALLHELGHLIIGMLQGFKVENILISPFGFAVRFKDIEFNDNICDINNESIEIKKMLTAVAGPAVNVAIIICVNLFHFDAKITEFIIFSNILIAVFNLLPIYPLDGGRILKYIFNIIFDKRKAFSYVKNVSYIFMFVLSFFSSIWMYYTKNIVVFFVIVYLWTIVKIE